MRFIGGIAAFLVLSVACIATIHGWGFTTSVDLTDAGHALSYVVVLEEVDPLPERAFVELQGYVDTDTHRVIAEGNQSGIDRADWFADGSGLANPVFAVEFEGKMRAKVWVDPYGADPAQETFWDGHCFALLGGVCMYWLPSGGSGSWWVIDNAGYAGPDQAAFNVLRLLNEDTEVEAELEVVYSWTSGSGSIPNLRVHTDITGVIGWLKTDRDDPDVRLHAEVKPNRTESDDPIAGGLWIYDDEPGKGLVLKAYVAIG